MESPKTKRTDWQQEKGDNWKMYKPFYRIDDTPLEPLRFEGDFSVRRFHETAFFYNRYPYLLYHRGFPFYSIIVSHSFPYLVSDASSPVGFSHAKVQRSSGVKYRYANGSWICPAAFSNQRWPFSPPPCHACRVG